jgi:putative zinc finger/helix-turn-helix YgiT family protein
MNAIPECPECGKKMRKIDPKKLYHYTSCGLDHVWLKGIEVYECTCGEGIAWIPRIGQLHRVIAIELLKNPGLLEGNEVRFLRKHFRLKATELANILNVTKQTVSNWENGKGSMGLANDRLLRIFFMLKFRDEIEKSPIFAEAGRKILNEKSLIELYKVFTLSVKKKKRFSLNIDKEKLRTNLDPFEPVTA